MKKMWFIVVMICCLLVLSVEGGISFDAMHDNETLIIPSEYLDLPPPWFPDMMYEEALARRMSIREFSDQPISLQNISSLLWGVYGYFNGTRSIDTFDNRHVIKVYVLLEEGAYEYITLNHSLALIKKGDYRKIGQYDTAFLKLGFVWDTAVCSNQSIAAAEIGMMGQNVYLMANALDLGTVTTAQQTRQLYLLGLPLSEKPMIIMQVGYPRNPYDFTYEVFETKLPFPQVSTLSFVDAVIQKQRWAYLTGALTEYEVSQLLWAGYGTSFLVDNVNERRHRTVPSSHGTYPIEVLFANSSGLYQYQAVNHSLNKLKDEDVRDDVASASFPWVSSTDVFFIVVNKTKTNMSWAWFYEAGAIWHNMILEAASLGLAGNVVVGFDHMLIQNLVEETSFEPVVLIQIGEQDGFDYEKPLVTITVPKEGSLYFLGFNVGPFSKTVVVGRLYAKVAVVDDSLLMVEYYLNDKLFSETYWESHQRMIPRVLCKNCELTVVAYDYFLHSTQVTISFLKIF